MLYEVITIGRELDAFGNEAAGPADPGSAPTLKRGLERRDRNNFV